MVVFDKVFHYNHCNTLLGHILNGRQNHFLNRFEILLILHCLCISVMQIHFFYCRDEGYSKDKNYSRDEEDKENDASTSNKKDALADIGEDFVKV